MTNVVAGFVPARTGSKHKPNRSSELSPALVWIGRSLFPIVALLLIAGTALWGPFPSLVLTVLWWKVVTWVG
mgnify:CR=1 FL=1